MTVSVEVPEVGESVTEVIIANWLKQEGDYVEENEALVELDTDKISQDLPAPASGVLTSIKYQVDDTVGIGEVIAEIDTDAEVPAEGEATSDEGGAETTPDTEDAPSPEPVAEAGGTATAETPPEDAELSPAVRRLVEQHGVDPADVEGSGPDGRITKGDVLAYVESRDEASETAEEEPRERRESREAKRQRGEGPESPEEIKRSLEPQRLEERVRMSSLRQTIADRLLEVKQETAMLTTFQEADMSRVLELRENYQEEFKEENETKLGFMSFFVKAAIDALKRYPAINAELDDDEIVYKNYYNIGVAVGGPEGLVVPVVEHADQLSFAEVEQEVQNLANKVFENKLTMDDLQGGTFTITNGGIYGSMLSTPILNPPQSAILGMHNIVDRPVAVDGEVEIRPIMYLALSYDHRIVDGKEAVSFLRRIKECVENPERILLEV